MRRSSRRRLVGPAAGADQRWMTPRTSISRNSTINTANSEPPTTAIRRTSAPRRRIPGRRTPRTTPRRPRRPRGGRPSGSGRRRRRRVARPRRRRPSGLGRRRPAAPWPRAGRGAGPGRVRWTRGAGRAGRGRRCARLAMSWRFLRRVAAGPFARSAAGGKDSTGPPIPGSPRRGPPARLGDPQPEAATPP